MPAFAYAGLSSREAGKILNRVGLNVLPEQRPKSSLHIALSIFKEPMIALLLMGCIVYLFIGDLKEALLLFLMIGIVAFITYTQEKKTETALQKLKNLTSPRVKVFRDGREIILPGINLVPGDVIKLVEGDRVPADGRVLETNNLTVDEAAVSGESLPVIKDKKGTGLYSGTLVTSGWAIALVERTGIHSTVGQIGKNLNELHEHPTRIQLETNRIVMIFALVGFLVCLLVMLLIGIQHHDWIQGILSGLAIAMSILPEEFPVVLTIFMALGALRISLHQVLVRNLPTLETLGSATVLCVDKTGTLTENRMQISHVVSQDTSTVINGQPLDAAAQAILSGARLACPQIISDPMEKAIESIASAQIHLSNYSYTLLDHFPFDTQLRVIANAYTEKNSSAIHIYLKGAPETVTSLCHLSPPELKRIHTQISDIAKEGVRLIAVAKGVIPRGFRRDVPVSHYPFEFLGLIGFTDPLRREAPTAIRQCLRAGIRVIMLTGDHAETAAHIGRTLGLPGSDRVLTGNHLKSLSSHQLRHYLAASNVCARILPEQKLSIVQALQQNGEIVAMTGDGVNDAPALKAADLGISMGLRGTDVAREASDMVLLDDDFASIVKAVREGRRIFANIRKAVGFIIAVHVPIAFLALAPLILGWPTILSPIHIIILELIIDPASTLVFEAEPAETGLMDRPPRPVTEKLFNYPLLTRSLLLGGIVSAAVFTAYLLSFQLGFQTNQIRTIAFLTLIIGNTSLIMTSRSATRSLIATLREPNRALVWILLGVTGFICLALSVPVFRSLMALEAFSAFQLMLVLSLGLVTVVLSEFMKKILVKYNT